MSHLATEQLRIIVAGDKGSKVKEERECNTNVEIVVDERQDQGNGIRGQSSAKGDIPEQSS